MYDLPIQACEVESIKDVLFVDFYEILVSFGGEEPGDPASEEKKGRGQRE